MGKNNGKHGKKTDYAKRESYMKRLDNFLKGEEEKRKKEKEKRKKNEKDGVNE